MNRWDRLSRRRIHDLRIMNLEGVTHRAPHHGKPVEYYVLDSPDWVNIVALTPALEVVLIRQYRVGVDHVCLEIPGGLVDPGESPETAAVRELAEETGFVPQRVEKLGAVEPNPALFNNRCHTYLCIGCTQEQAPRPDDDEIIETELRPLTTVPDLIRKGDIEHALVVAAFYHLFQTRGLDNLEP